ncbi:MAG: JAB domain-containing protein [Alphaproteobacteria bacterium]|nr:MAG: JAB domain-containing protein [Alphaproteobacteria bacterium]
MAEPEKPHYLGHRERLRARFLAKGGGALSDYELLELLLCLAIPRRDVKPLAKALLARFGGFAEVIGAETSQLAAISGMGPAAVAALKSVQAGAERLTRAQVTKRPVLSNWQALLDYCRTAMAHQSREQFRVLFLNQKNMLTADELLQEGTINHAPVYPREVMRRALELGAAAIILVHNHPSGDPQPSREDIAMTKEIVEAGRRLGIAVHDHLVIGRHGHASFKGLGLL